MPRTSRATLMAVSATGLALVLASCSGGAGEDPASGTPVAGVVQVEDNHGTVEVPADPRSIVATDNRSFRMLEDWGVELSAGAVALMPGDSVYRAEGSGVIDLGNHNEPDLEAIVAAQPDLVINGQRFSQYYDDIAALVPDAAIVEADPREGEPFDAELRRHTEVVGAALGHEEEAAALIADFDASIARVQAAYDAEQTVMGVITSGGEINYSAPTVGRTLGPVYDILGLTPSLEVGDGSSFDQGDDISVEAIADSDPDWILVMDRDAGVSVNTDGVYTPANELLATSPALQNVTAVQQEQIVYMPQNTYLDEGIQTYTEFFDSLADAMEQS